MTWSELSTQLISYVQDSWAPRMQDSILLICKDETSNLLSDPQNQKEPRD